MNKFNVLVKPGFENHFKTTLRAFDENATIKLVDNHIQVATKVPKEEISGFTSVKRVEEICSDEVAKKEVWKIEDAFKTPISVNEIHSFFQTNRHLNLADDVITRDLDNQLKDNVLSWMRTVSAWGRNFPLVNAQPPCPCLQISLQITPSSLGGPLTQVVLYYKSSRPINTWAGYFQIP